MTQNAGCQIAAPGGVVHLRTSDGAVVCGRDAEGWSTGVTEAMRMGLVERCEDCGRKAPGLLHHAMGIWHREMAVRAVAERKGWTAGQVAERLTVDCGVHREFRQELDRIVRGG